MSWLVGFTRSVCSCGYCCSCFRLLGKSLTIQGACEGAIHHLFEASRAVTSASFECPPRDCGSASPRWWFAEPFLEPGPTRKKQGSSTCGRESGKMNRAVTTCFRAQAQVWRELGLCTGRPPPPKKSGQTMRHPSNSSMKHAIFS